MRINDWSSDVCSSDLIDVQDGVIRHDIIGAAALDPRRIAGKAAAARRLQPQREVRRRQQRVAAVLRIAPGMRAPSGDDDGEIAAAGAGDRKSKRLELQSLMRISYAVFCLNKKP